MLSPKMQRSVRVNDAQLVMLSERAQVDNSLSGYLHKRAGDSGKWQQRWFILYQNLLFYYDSQSCTRPSGVVMLEGCYCERLITSGSKKDNSLDKQHYCFAISYRRDNIRQYELRASSETDCKMWIEAIREASFNKVLMQKEELEQKHLHLLQIVESEKTAKWQYTQRCEELDTEIKKLRAELCALKKELRPDVCGAPTTQPTTVVDGTGVPADSDTGETLELRKIKKVQSFFRGWLCRRRWKQIVEQYIKSPHAESMRKRNSLVFRMVEAEEEYMEQMEVLVSCFLRPFKMAASSKKPPCSHEDVNSIFLNSETVLFLHQIFLKGLTSRMESWPTLVLGDLFDMLLPMLSIYQEYVRNHHYSVQVLTECMKSPTFAALVHRMEEKPTCQGRSLATFLTYPMHQVPRYVTTLTDLLAHTPHDHVERKSLMNAQHQLEDLSRQMHDEVSETENLRKNLAVERMIVEGCDILLDVNQVFVRQGTLIQLPNDKRTNRSRLASFKSEKEAVRQCFLFSNHLIIATRASNGRLHLVPNVGKIPLADAMLIEDPSDPGTADDDESSICSMSSQSSGVSEASSRGTPSQWHNKDFKIVVDSVKTGSGSCSSSVQISVHLLAPTMQEKAAWISDITQCMDNVHFNDLLHMSISDTSSVTMPQSIKNDPKLFKDDVDIRFSRTQVNSCKVPQIRYATPERLLERLTDLRFLSIDFLNTFLLTYRVFTDSVTVLEALKKVFYNADPPEMSNDGISILLEDQISGLFEGDRRRSSAFTTPRRVSGASSVSGYGSEMSDRSHSYDSQGFRWRANVRKFEEEHMNRLREGVAGALQQQQQQQQQQQSQPQTQQQQSQPQTPVRRVSIRVEHESEDTTHLMVPGGAGGATTTTCSASSSSETLVGNTAAPSSPSGLSTVTLVPSTSTSPTPSVQGSQDSSGKSQESVNTVIEKEQKEGQGEKESEKEKERAEEKEKDEKEKETGKEKKNSQQDKEKKAKGKDKAKDKDKDKDKLNGEESEKDRVPPLRCRSSRLGDRRPSASERRPSIIMTNAAGRMERRLSYSERRPSADNSSSSSRRPSSAERRPSSCDRRLSSSERRSPRSQAKRKSSDCGGSGYGGSWKRDSITTDPWTSEDSQDTPRSSARSASIASSALSYYSGGRRLTQDSTISMMSRPSIQHDLPQVSSKAGVVITSSRQSHRRLVSAPPLLSNGWPISPAPSPQHNSRLRYTRSRYRGNEVRVQFLNILLRNCCTRSIFFRVNERCMLFVLTPSLRLSVSVTLTLELLNFCDFDQDQKLKSLTIQFLEDIQCSPSLLPAEYKAAGQLLRLITKEEPENSKVDLNVLLAPPTSPSKENIETLSALEIAEQMTYLDHQIFVSICSEEFLGQAWIKEDKNVKAPRIEAMTKRFNQMSALVVSEIIRRPNITARVAVIEKWAAVADIARCLHNFNGVLQICAAFNNNVVFRLKKTWEKVSKTTKQTIDKLHGIVSSDGRFRNLREALHRCDPPCIPYLGMYLTDLSFIEESTPNFSHDKLLNFSKMRMIAHVIREVRNFQQVPYKIEHMPKVTNYLQDTALVLDEEEMYRLSLEIEPRASRLSAANTAAIVSVTTSHNRLFPSGSHDRDR
ncbi:ras-specific guanine nucleotide-releasing factor 2-like [Frankliniella occidentalis]|uniref:Ras-specific guanine nucleotide-releasing factor 2-like n=1 Tax=Frankliniella occidentalis TaxID=133901 RepID=A0A9C6WNH4_FRAOC|nr:ras-specific guanine nucleotide-releasing factor 2-like [Frankliniella occidentalis]